jgi:alpha-glucuronidase
MVARQIAVALASACLFLCANSASASDPHGYAILSFEWVEDPGETLGPDERVLRVVVKPVVEADSVHLTYKTPDDVSVSPREGFERGPPGADGAPRLTLGDFQRNQTKSVEFVVHAPSGKSGVAVFTVSGELAPDREFEEKVGWTVGTPTAPTVRHGAAEFPARIEPE